MVYRLHALKLNKLGQSELTDGHTVKICESSGYGS